MSVAIVNMWNCDWDISQLDTTYLSGKNDAGWRSVRYF